MTTTVWSIVAELAYVPRSGANVWRLYELYKQRIAAVARTPDEYEDAIRELVKVLGL